MQDMVSNFYRLPDSQAHCVRFPSQGPDLLLLHGIGSSWESWLPVLNQLQGHFNVFAVDWRGHGQSGKPPAGYLLADYASDLNDLINILDLTQPLIMGHSLGGMVTLHWLASHPDGARRIVLEDAPLQSSASAVSLFEEWLELLAQPVEEIAASYQATFPHWTADDCRRRARVFSATTPAVFLELKRLAIAGVQQDLISPLAGVTTPILQIHGDIETGSAVVPADLERLLSTAPGVTSRRIPSGNHNLHRDLPEEFLAAAIPFLLA